MLNIEPMASNKPGLFEQKAERGGQTGAWSGLNGGWQPPQPPVHFPSFHPSSPTAQTARNITPSTAWQRSPLRQPDKNVDLTFWKTFTPPTKHNDAKNQIFMHFKRKTSPSASHEQP